MINQNKIALLFSFLGALLVTWKFMLPGYILVLDSTVGPQSFWPNLYGHIFSNYLGFLLNYFLGIFFGTMLAQKIYIFSLFFCMFYLPIRFFPFSFPNYYKYLASLFFVFNPFVYERFLAGQFGVLFGYALIFPFIYFLVKVIKGEGIVAFTKLIISFFIIGCLSFHFYIMSAIVLLFTFPFWVSNIDLKKFNTYGLVTIVFLIFNLYWLIPVFSGGFGYVQSMDYRNELAFKTEVMTGKWTGYLSIFSLYGFWGEGEGWSATMGVSPRENVFAIVFILVVCIFGFLKMYLMGGINRKLSLIFGLILFLASIFSVGVSENIFKDLNQFLFDSIWFWRGFRDTQKWTGLMLPILSIFLVFGFVFLNEKIKNLYFQFFIYSLIILAIIIYSYKIMFGFYEKLVPVNYPKEWYEVNELLKQTENCSAVFLPWEMYYYLSFNNNILTGNPAKLFFDCKIYTSLDPEYKGIGDSLSLESDRLMVHDIMKNSKNIKDIPKLLAQVGVKYIIVSVDEFKKPKYSGMFNDKVIPKYISNQIVLISVDDILK